MKGEGDERKSSREHLELLERKKGEMKKGRASLIVYTRQLCRKSSFQAFQYVEVYYKSRFILEDI